MSRRKRKVKAAVAQPQMDDTGFVASDFGASVIYSFGGGMTFGMDMGPVTRQPLTKHLVAGPTHGYRLWPVYTNQHGDLWLGSMGVVAEGWRMGAPTRARCHSDRLWGGAFDGDHEAPHEHCDCGVYAVNDLRHLDLYREPVERKDGTCLAIAAGRVALWGRVYEHEKGYRAQYAYPAALWPYQTTPTPHGFPKPRRWLELFLRLGETYGVPIFPEAA